MSVTVESSNISVGFPFRGSLILRGQGTQVPAKHHFAVLPTAWGPCGIVWTVQDNVAADSQPFSPPSGPALLTRIMTAGLSVAELRRTLLAKHPFCNEVIGDGQGNFHPEVVPEWFTQLAAFLTAYYANSFRTATRAQPREMWSYWKSRLDWSQVTAFQRRVLEVTAEIPRGMAQSYGQVAKRIGNARASRAVGAALGANVWPVLIPCHRVVGSSGAMTGFSAPGGVTAKQRMLEMERD